MWRLGVLALLLWRVVFVADAERSVEETVGVVHRLERRNSGGDGVYKCRAFALCKIVLFRNRVPTAGLFSCHTYQSAYRCGSRLLQMRPAWAVSLLTMI
ncbi:hypothetical protein R3P38DRAFT_2933300 [Favolaschia claudopus]|uniref:Secreted protein n=1 Tax=Favolaschia claudopus TaxID=2862362 RepID=A0AAW0BU43_9AGAR